jgi:alpha-tubulin suppressor-like RCC1 family protein
MQATGKPSAAQYMRGKGTATRACAVATILLVVTALLAVGAGTASARIAGAGATPFVNTAPKVTKQPSNLTVEEGQPASFESTASGTPTPTVQWEVSSNGGSSFSAIEGATAPLYTIASAKTSDSGHLFRAVFKNSVGEVTSKAVTLSVQKAPAVTLQPVPKTAEEGHPVSFESTASGFPAPTVQWQSEASGSTTWKNVTGATSTVLTISSPKSTENQTKFRAVFKNVAGEAISEGATLTVANLPKITKQPTSMTTKEGEFAIFESIATGPPSPTVQWEVSSDHGATWTLIPGAKDTQLVVKGTNESINGDQYRARFTNAAGSTTSNAATLTVEGRPIVTKQPKNQLVLAGESASFESAGKGTPNPTVHWEVSSDHGATWAAVPGATNLVFTISETVLSQNGNLYRAAFSNSIGTTDSEPASLVVASHNYNAFGWGMNLKGEVGSGSTEQSITSPMPVKGLNFVTAIAAGMHHSLALTASGAIQAWGSNVEGQLGNEQVGTSRVPVPVEIIKSATAIAAGGAHSLALLANATVMAWGENEAGELGNGKHTESEFPIAVPELTNVTAIAAGEEHSLALLSNGTVMAWGSNERGQLGTGNTNSSASPVAVKGLTEVAAIAAGGQYSVALLKNGTVLAWGDDEHGQLGNMALRIEEEEEVEEGTVARKEEGLDSPNPVVVEALSGVKQIAAGHTHALALLGDGTVMAWGEGDEGELGNGTMPLRADTPVAIPGLANVTEVSAGDQISTALLNSGLVDAWGNNRNGELGQGTTGEDSDVPVTVTSLGGAVGISAGGSHMLAFGASLPAVSAISPNSGATSGGTSVTITGSGLGAATAVKFGANSAPSFTINSSTSITATSPAGSGTVNITVVTPTGSSPPVSADHFTYKVPPTIFKMSAKGGPASGGTTITIEGTELSGTTAVDFGAVPGTELKINSNSSITVVSPANVSGTLDVRVFATGGESPVTTKDHFKYTPVVLSFSPPSAPIAGGTMVEVSGAGFALGAGTKFKFGKAASKSVNCTSTTSCLVKVPAQSTAGTVDVKATANKANSVIGPSDQFIYE